MKRSPETQQLAEQLAQVFAETPLVTKRNAFKASKALFGTESEVWRAMKVVTQAWKNLRWITLSSSEETIYLTPRGYEVVNGEKAKAVSA